VNREAELRALSRVACSDLLAFSLFAPVIIYALLFNYNRIRLRPIPLPSPAFLRAGSIFLYPFRCRLSGKLRMTVRATRRSATPKATATATGLEKRLNVRRDAPMHLQLDLFGDVTEPATQERHHPTTIAISISRIAEPIVNDPITERLLAPVASPYGS